MTCPICDQKGFNCDCTQNEKEMHERIEELEAELKEGKESRNNLLQEIAKFGLLEESRMRQAFEAARKTPGDNLRLSNELFGYYVFRDFEDYEATLKKEEQP